ncbi:MAG: TlpA family protein disulfide reductase [Clostridia bacterium]|nr:TlpA family protein disulfide reductase [Clostridia bacterium]
MKKRTMAWMAALAVLACALVYFNVPAPAGTGATEDTPEAGISAQYASDAPVGWHVGEQLPEFTLTTMTGEEFVLSAHRGRVTVINLWATWCTPCVNELPCFDRLQNEHPEDVTVLAIHSNLITDDVAKYLSGFDYGIAFAVDETGDVISSVGGSTMLPQTVVLNPWGEVTYNKVGSVTFEMLEELTEAAQTR